MDNQVSFLAANCPDLSANTIRLSINCMLSEFALHEKSDTAAELKSLPQSTPIKRCQMKKLLPSFPTNLLDELSTPPNSPTEKFPKSKVPKKARNLSLTLLNCEHNDAASTVTDCVVRRRKSWTLSETLILWHAVQLALPNPPSWAKIRDEFFASSRRTNVDLKDRWRVVMRDPALQAYIRQCYDKWLASKNPT
ncbi:unnamed protein product [Taenia asiatica]|uniref:Myb-like domain-containing protein n=1 Tax=Taenia asiatica TaxID=60517 RepID=A0A0R3WDU2_TAEAS|nr:unnamed protein product [Taenia asiatica]